MAKYEAGFIGAGNMGGALALAAAKKTGGDRIAVACSTRERSEAAAQRLGCTAETAQRILSDSRFVFLGVKPQMVVGVVESLKADIRCCSARTRRSSASCRIRPAPWGRG